MSDIQNGPFATKRLRTSLFVFACVLGTLATWILVAEVLRAKKGIEFTTDAQLAAANYEQRDAALTAARTALVRGDLWSEVAFAYGDMLWSENKRASSADALSFDQIKALTEQAIAYAPHDSRLWLLSAANYLRFDWLNERAASSLRMSFYTGTNSMALVPGRLLLAVQSRALQDDDFRELVRHDIQMAVTYRSELKPALIDAYNKAPPAGRQFIEKTLAELDPSMLASIRTEKDHQ
jgi:hypothetical protein